MIIKKLIKNLFQNMLVDCNNLLKINKNKFFYLNKKQNKKNKNFAMI